MITLRETGGGAAAWAGGGREYRQVFLTRGPGPVGEHLAAPGLPQDGESYQNGFDGTDVHATCRGLAGPPEPVPGGYRLAYVYATDPSAGPDADRPLTVPVGVE